jgi:hypothetical protein
VRLQSRTRVIVIGAVALFGCARAKPPEAPPYVAGSHRLVALPADSISYPSAAERATAFLQRTRVRGFDAPELAKVSLEVAQLSIECVEPSEACYTAVGKSLSANQLLFAQFDAGPEAEQVRVSVTLFDVDGATTKRTARKVFETEQDAVYGLRDVVEEATK